MLKAYFVDSIQAADLLDAWHVPEVAVEWVLYAAHDVELHAEGEDLGSEFVQQVGALNALGVIAFQSRKAFWLRRRAKRHRIRSALGNLPCWHRTVSCTTCSPARRCHVYIANGAMLSEDALLDVEGTVQGQI